MIHVQITILDARNMGRPIPILDLAIVNDATGTFETGNYEVRSSDGHLARIEGFDRRTPDGAVALVKEAIDLIVPS